MKPARMIVLLVSCFALLSITSCEVTETTESSDAELMILTYIAEDDSSFAIDDWDDNEDLDLGLAKNVEGVESAYAVDVFDSTSIWRFGRLNMSREREVLVEMENDSMALAQIIHHVTGDFHVRQYERTWLDDGSWERGDSIRFSVKPIVLDLEQRVMFRKRVNNAGEERWRPVMRSMVYGSSGPEIENLHWIAGDSMQVITDFEDTLYGWNNQLVLISSVPHQLEVEISNDVPGEAEFVRGSQGFHRHNQDRRRDVFQYVSSTDSGSKIYESRMMGPDRPRRMYRGHVRVLDLRTLYDHDYVEYSAATLHYTYFHLPRWQDRS